MASSCCTDLSSCNGEIYSSNCVVWGGDDITNYNITEGIPLTSIIGTITTELDNLKSGADITLSGISLSGCSAISDLTGGNKSLTNLIQALINYQCTLKSYIDLKTNTVPVTYDTKCLTLVDNTEGSIIQALINLSCTNSASFSSLSNSVTANSAAITSLQGDIAAIKGQNGTMPAFTQSQLMPYFVPMPYIGSLDNFDSSGKGIGSKGYDQVYIMNGLNGTQDWRGYSPIGANNGVPGGTLDSRVDPSKNPNFSINPGGKIGEAMHLTTITEIPSHNHSITDNGHSHSYNGMSDTNGGGIYGGYATNHTRGYKKLSTDLSQTGIVISATGGGQPHNNIQPSVGCIWIVKLP